MRGSAAIRRFESVKSDHCRMKAVLDGVGVAPLRHMAIFRAAIRTMCANEVLIQGGYKKPENGERAFPAISRIRESGGRLRRGRWS